MAHSKTDHSKMDHFKMDHAPAPDAPRTPIPPLSDADRAAAFPANLHGHETHDQRIVSFLQFNRLEAWDADHGTGQAWEATAWVGNDWHRLWLRSEGEREGGRTESADLEVLYGRPVAPWWDMVAGIRHDVRPGPSQTWLALGVVGLAPYKFEVSATAYLGESGRAAARIEAEYELLLTNRWILQPLVEVELHGKADPARGVGSGLGTIEAGARLRYEFSRRFAPYVGLVWERAFGDTADFRSSEGEHVDDTRLVAGVRFAF
jgi:copper resistance protein B